MIHASLLGESRAVKVRKFPEEGKELHRMPAARVNGMAHGIAVTPPREVPREKKRSDQTHYQL